MSELARWLQDGHDCNNDEADRWLSDLAITPSVSAYSLKGAQAPRHGRFQAAPRLRLRSWNIPRHRSDRTPTEVQSSEQRQSLVVCQTAIGQNQIEARNTIRRKSYDEAH